MYLLIYYDNLISYLWTVVIGCVSSEQTGGNRAEENTFKSLMVPAAQSSSHGGKLRGDVTESLDGASLEQLRDKGCIRGTIDFASHTASAVSGPCLFCDGTAAAN
jgi:hypothetical protein